MERIMFFFFIAGGRTDTQTMSLSASNELYINNSCASVFPFLSAGQESMLSRSTTGEV